MITPEDKKLMEELKKDRDAYNKLRAKAQWEQISLFAVLKDYGDPRKW